MPRPTGQPSAELDTQQWRQLQADLRRFAPDVKRELNKEMRALVRPIAADARRRAPKRTGELRRKIVPQVTTRKIGVVSKAPHARITEFGGRHPVFGNRDTWVTQPARPHLFPAAHQARPDLHRAAAQAIDRATLAAGFR